MMKIYLYLSAVALGLCSAAASATTIGGTTWTSTDGNVNLINFDFTSIGGMNITTAGGDLRMFNTSGTASLDFGATDQGGQVAISGDATNGYFATNTSNNDQISLGNTGYFTLGVSWDQGGSWFGGYNVQQLGTNDYLAAFDVNKGYVQVNDVNPVCVSAVPVPAAAWLFGSGLIGLVGVARRRRA